MCYFSAKLCIILNLTGASAQLGTVFACEIPLLCLRIGLNDIRKTPHGRRNSSSIFLKDFVGILLYCDIVFVQNVHRMR